MEQLVDQQLAPFRGVQVPRSEAAVLQELEELTHLQFSKVETVSYEYF